VKEIPPNSYPKEFSDDGKPAMIGNFRPIGLLDVLRKVWTKMLMRKILPLLDSHSVLKPNQFTFLSSRDTFSELIQLLNLLE
jgi:hypothetical protein